MYGDMISQAMIVLSHNLMTNLTNTSNGLDYLLTDITIAFSCLTALIDSVNH